MKFGIGQSVSRVEDPRLLKGAGSYVDDITLPGQLYGMVFRSPYAHARLVSIDVADARAVSGVAAVYTAEDSAIAGLNDLATQMPVKNADGSRGVYPTLPHLAKDTVRFVGQPVAFIVAESIRAAKDAVDLIMAEFEDLPVVVEGEAALIEGAPQLHESAVHNRAYDWEVGDKDATDAAFAAATHISKLRMENTRIIVNAMEPRAINVAYAEDRWDIHVSTQGSHAMRGQIAGVLGVEPQRLRVRVPDVGGGFGMKLMLHPEYGLACAAAQDLGRPVKWTGDRSESFLSDLQGRDLTTYAEAACDSDGRIRAMRLSSISNLGAYPSRAGPSCHTAFCGDLAPTVYNIPAIHNRVQGVYTNTTPTDAYRGAGRPEQNYIMERLIDRVGADLGIAQDEIRRRNLATPDMMPWTTALGVPFDSGDFPGILEATLERADVAGFASRRAETEARGKLLGQGIVCYMERTGGAPEETARIEIFPAKDGQPDRVRVEVGTQSTGQGHETAFPQLVHAKLGVPYECIEWVAGDSDSLPQAGGTGGSRSVIMASKSFFAASDEVIRLARPAAAEELEVSEVDLEFEPENGGQFRVVGTDKTATLFTAVARLEGGTLTGEAKVDGGSKSFPNGCHICEVEITPETGEIALTKYTVIDDFGTLLNPMLATGQIVGGVAQGVGEALHEAAIYDSETGQPLTGSFMDYQMPRAYDLPPIDVGFRPTFCTTNPLGAKGCGEAGTVGAAGCTVIAVLDALRPFGIEEIDMPITPAKVWNALQQSSLAEAAE